METQVGTNDRKQTGFRLPRELLQKLGHVAVARELSLNEVVEKALSDWYNTQKESADYGKASEPQPQKRGPKPTSEPSEEETSVKKAS